MNQNEISKTYECNGSTLRLLVPTQLKAAIVEESVAVELENCSEHILFASFQSDLHFILADSTL